MSVTIYHNPRCSKSRQTLQLLADRGVKPQVIEYLQDPPSAAELKHLLTLLGMGPRQLLRRNEAIYTELGLGGAELSDEQLIAAMVTNPVLIERPLVLANGQARIGRPPEGVLEIL